MKKRKHMFCVLMVLSFLVYPLFAQNNTTVVLEGTWVVIGMRLGDQTVDESAIIRSNMEYNVIIENNIGIMIRIVNGVPTSATRFVVTGNTMLDESGGELPYSLDNNILTITFPSQNLVLTCRKKIL